MCGNRKSPVYRGVAAYTALFVRFIFFHPDFTVGFGITPNQPKGSQAILPVENLTSWADTRHASPIYDPSPEEVFEGMIPSYLCGLLYSAIVDSFASEQAARRAAMESASDNADEMIGNLSLMYNRARQAQITQELTEISSATLNDSV